MTSTVTITLTDGTRVVVPDSLDLITPYVLQEQQDWFEDEIKFLRILLAPGMKVIDIGANYGVYSLSMARSVGPGGHVWAFEPASGTANFLELSAAANGFGHVTVERIALSGTLGSAQLSVHEHSEMNALVRAGTPAGATETVAVSTLDECMNTRAWRDIAFVKIDAEGEEANILKGGTSFFAAQSPLVQFEVKVGNALHMELVEAFSALGYDSYRLVPGLDLLVRFDAATPDPFLLNLFCCKLDRAEALAAAGRLVGAADISEREQWLARIRDKTGSRGAWNWRNTLATQPYARELAGRWELSSASGRCGDIEGALACHALSRDSSAPAAERYFALEAGLGRLMQLCEAQPLNAHLASLARAAKEYGARTIATNALTRLCSLLLQHQGAVIDEPFLAPAERFDTIPAGTAPERWMLAGALEELERLGAYSSFYTEAATRVRLKMMRDLGFDGAEMQRRRDLLERKAKKARN